MTTNPIEDFATPTVDNCRLIQLPRVPRRQGNITAVEAMTHVPFEIARVYYLYDIPGGIARGGHGHRQLEQIMVAVMGSFDIVFDDGERKKTMTLNRAYDGIYIPRMIWRELLNFSSGAVCLVLASLPYDEGDYFRDYEEFLGIRREIRGEQ